MHPFLHTPFLTLSPVLSFHRARYRFENCREKVRVTLRGFMAACATCSRPIKVELASAAAEPSTSAPRLLRSGSTGVHPARKLA